MDNMIGHSDQWEEQRQEVRALIGQYEGRFYNLLQQSREPLTKQLTDNKVRNQLELSTFPHLYPSVYNQNQTHFMA